MLPAVLIDSGASCNVIDQTTWEAMKKESVKCDSKKFRAKCCLLMVKRSLLK